MLELRNVNISTYNDRKIIENLSLVINSGDKLCIIGEEGNGKSTLLKYIVDERKIQEYCICSGQIKKDNLKIGYLEQFLDDKYKKATVTEYLLMDVELNIDYEKYEKIGEIYKLMEQFQLDKSILDNEQVISTLSGGEKIKVQFVKILLDEPNILLLDEPSNDIDILTLEWLENYILSCPIPIVYISHDETLLENTANSVLHLEQLNNKSTPKYTYEHIGYKEYVEKRKYNISRQNMIAGEQKRKHEKQMEQFRKLEQRVDFELNAISRQNPSGGRLLKKKMKSVKSLEKRLEQNEEDLVQKVYVEESINSSFHNDGKIYKKRHVLDFHLDILKCANKVLSKDIFLEVIGTQKLCITGKNGCGKTTLLKYIYQNMKNGDIKIGYMPQDYDDELIQSISPIEFLKNDYSKEEETLFRTYLGSMKFTEQEMQEKISNLSGGQKAKLYLVKLIMSRCDVLILDEPTRNLSPLSNPVIRDVLKQYNGAIISVSHDRKYINEVCDKVYELNEKGLFLLY